MAIINGKSIKYQWYCEKHELVSINGYPKEYCTRKCEHLIKTSLGRAISRELRENVYQRDNRKCIVCGKTNWKMTLDHLIPVDKGGTNDEWNLATMCEKCNCEKGNKIIDEFVALAKKLRQEYENAH